MAYTTIQSFKAFDAFKTFEFGYAAAQSVIFVLVVALVTVVQRRAVALSARGW